MFTALILFVLSSGHPCIDSTSGSSSALVEFEPQPRTSERIVRCDGCRGGCRAREVFVVIDGVPIESEIVVGPDWKHSALAARPNTPWLVTFPADHFTRETVFRGEWIQTRPRLRY